MSDHRNVSGNEDPINTCDVLELSASDESDPEETPREAPFDPELDHSDEDREMMTSASASAPTAQGTFTLSGGSSGFSFRSRNIFDCLDSVEKRSITALNQGKSAGTRKTSHPPSTSPIPEKKRGVPDYLVHPERWTRYSLEDVAESSNEDNRRAAQEFLSSLNQVTKSDPRCDIQKRMIFSRPQRLLKEQVPVQLFPDLQGKEKLQLSHLAEEDEDNEGRERAEVKEQTTETIKQEIKNEEESISEAVALEEEKKLDKSTINFTSYRKTKVKNYRNNSAEKDE